MLKVSKAVIEKDGKYFLIKREANADSFPNVWDFPGGRFEIGETPAEAIIREVKEETDFLIEPGIEVKQAQYHDEKRGDIFFHYFVPTSVVGEPKLSTEHSAMRRFHKEEIKTLEKTPSVRIFFDL